MIVTFEYFFISILSNLLVPMISLLKLLTSQIRELIQLEYQFAFPLINILLIMVMHKQIIILICLILHRIL
jgi:hypothetical protein